MPATIDVIDAHNATVTVNAPSDRGAGATTATTMRTALANDCPPLTVEQGNVNTAQGWIIQGLAGGTPVPISGPVTVNGIPTTAADRGQGAATANTARVTIDNTQVSPLVKGSVPTLAGGNTRKVIAASATNTVIQNTTGAIGDYVEGVLCVVDTPASSQVLLADGATPAAPLDEILPANPGAGIGPYYVPVGATSSVGGWHITTGAGVHCWVMGTFS